MLCYVMLLNVASFFCLSIFCRTPPTDDLIPKTRCGRNQHSLAFQIPSASKDVYQYSFFPQTIKDWNDLPESLISSSELSDDSVSKFTSLVRARD